MSLETPPIADIIIGAVALFALVWTIWKRSDIAHLGAPTTWIVGWALVGIVNLIGLLAPAHELLCVPYILGSAAAIIVLVKAKKD